MNNTLHAWAARHNIPQHVFDDLITSLVTPPDIPFPTGDDRSEAAIQAQIRVDVSRAGGRVWRNNVGAGKLDSGSFVRFGLANESAAMNRQIKSADLIGIMPVKVTPAHVGTTIGQFVSIECKRSGWRYSGDEHERAQCRWLEIVQALGGRAMFSTGGVY